MKLPHFEIHFPESHEEALDLANHFGARGRYLAGGTDLLVSLKMGAVSASHLIDISGIRGLSEIRDLSNGELELGVNTPLHQVAGSKIIQEHAPALSQAAEVVGTTQIRNVASLGGNLCQNTRCRYFNRTDDLAQILPLCLKRGGEVCHVVPGKNRCFATYQGDLAAALLAHDATLKVERKNESRVISIESLFTGDGKDPLALEPGELITAIRIPESRKTKFSGYRKYRLRRGIDFPLVGVAVCRVPFSKALPEGGFRVGLTGIGSQPIGLGFKETPSDKSLSEVIEKTIQPVNNVSGSAWHRRIMAQQLACDLSKELRAKMEAGIE